MNTEPRFAHLLHLAQRNLFRTVDRQLQQQLGISSAQLGVLYYLGEHPDCRLGELSDGLMLNNSAVTGAVNRMSVAGLVRRETVPGDRRAWRVVMTARGHRALEQAAPLLAEFNQRIRAGFSAGELAIVQRFLEEVIARFGPTINEETAHERGDTD